MEIISKASLLVVSFLIISVGLHAKNYAPPFNDIPQDSFTLDGIVDSASSEPFACTIGKSVVEKVQIKDGLKHFKLRGMGILINSGYINKGIHENPDIIWTVPESSSIENGSVLSLHAFKTMRNKDGSQPIDFYVLYSQTPGEFK